MPRLRRWVWLVSAVLSLCLSMPARAQERPPSTDPTDIVNALLSGLLGFRNMTGAELQQEVAEIGGMPFKRDVPLDFMSRDQMTRYFGELIDSEYPKPRADADARLLRSLDLLPADTDLRQVRLRLLLDNVVGFYDERPNKRRLYAVSDDTSLTPSNQLVLAHELRHALQDQYMSIHGILPDGLSDFDDRQIALLSLLEGDATLVMERFLTKRLPGADESALSMEGLTLPTPDMPGTPAVLRDQMVLPYTVGLQFVRALYQQGGWDAVRGAFSRPPDSSEQVLHPEKYLARESPRKVATPPAPAGGRVVLEGVLGELMLRTLLGEGQDEAAAGWGGDAFRVFDVKGRTLVTLQTVWDSDRDLREFQAALLGRFERSFGGAQTQRGFRVFSSKGSSVAIGDWSGGLLVLAADDVTVLTGVLQRLPAS